MNDVPNLGVMLPGELTGINLAETIQIAQLAEANGFDSVWKEETSGTNTFMTLSAIARTTSSIELGTGVANVFSRSPTFLAMSAATLDELSGGRTLLGLGVSSPPLIEGWHGIDYERPLRRLRETIEILRQAFTERTVDYDGDIYDIGPYSVGFELDRDTIPVYNAAMGETNRRLTAEFADGWMPIFIPRSKFDEFEATLQKRASSSDRDPVTCSPMVPCAVAEDTDQAERQVRNLIAQEMAMGYNSLVDQFGFGKAADEAHDQWRAGDRDAAAAALSQEMVDEFAIYGTPSECRERLADLATAGAESVILWPSMSASSGEVRELIESLGPEQ